MSYAMQSRPASATLPAALRRFAVALRRRVRNMSRELGHAWRYAAARRDFNRVDDSTLRDLGMTRGEFDSYWAETHGLAEPTRMRIIRRKRGSGL